MKNGTRKVLDGLVWSFGMSITMAIGAIMSMELGKKQLREQKTRAYREGYHAGYMDHLRSCGLLSEDRKNPYSQI